MRARWGSVGSLPEPFRLVEQLAPLGDAVIGQVEPLSVLEGHLGEVEVSELQAEHDQAQRALEHARNPTGTPALAAARFPGRLGGGLARQRVGPPCGRRQVKGQLQHLDLRGEITVPARRRGA